MTTVRLLWLLSFAVLLQSCTSVPRVKSLPNIASQAMHQQHLQNISDIESFTLQGRVGVQANGKGFSGGLNWQHNNSNDDISLYSPLGGQVASIKKTLDQVTLEEANGNSMTAADSETLTQNTLGWPLPLTGLADWTLGRPASGSIDEVTWDEQGRINTLKQGGWDIEYQNYSDQNGHVLPRKISLKSEKVNLKLLVEKWVIFSPANKDQADKILE